MPNINLTLIVNGIEKCYGEGIIDDKDKIVYTLKRGAIPSSHGQYTLSEVYGQLTELVKTNYPNKHYEIKIEINNNKN